MSDELPPILRFPDVPALDDRMQRLNRAKTTNDWEDDEDIIDADERATARAKVGDHGTLTVPQAAEVLAQQKPSGNSVRKYVNPYEALLDELRRTVAFVVMLEASVQEHDRNGGAHRTAAGRSVLARYERERDRQIKISETAIRLGIAERTVRLAERQAEEVVRLVAAAAGRSGLTTEQRRSLMNEIAAEVRAQRNATAIEARAVAG